ncbi:MAG: ribulose-phosphate 3-epimerase [Flavobacteriaceae bacterium]|nr:ribulose-phosphate 3-epimerase [Flavobacteriaceae bacterium]MCY4268204.1 ribulose-phosphate 3-epimerase [Flavobacteriaceae bacterium]MCY4300081.1 ribulose-phosphate 3-epimerase [Flavobacteriaceae bacterium]
MLAPLIAPSILAADFGLLKQECDMVNESAADWFHLDIMDGVFVPNLSFGTPVVKSIAKAAKKPLDIHLMMIDPDRYLDLFIDLGARFLTVHYEACTHLNRTINYIQSKDVQAGVALNPHTNVSLLEDLITEIDLVCLMSVNPGFGGQKFIESTYQKVKQTKSLIEKHHASTLIEIDGGVNDQNAKKLYVEGADVLVAGSHIFSSSDPQKTIKQLKYD